MRRAPAILLLLAMLGGAAYGAFHLASHSLEQLLGFSPVYLQTGIEAPASAPLSPRLVLILVDDLSPAEALRLPSLEWLERQGSHWQMAVKRSTPENIALTTLLTGLDAARYGVYPLDRNRSMVADNFIGAARRHGLHIAAIGGESLIAQALPWLNRGSFVVTESTETQITERIRSLLAAGGPDLTVIQLATPHTAGSREGALAALDERINQFMDLIDLNAMTVLVVGVSPPTGLQQRHEVPLIGAGVGIAPGAYGAAHPEDIAPTVSALLGLPPLAHAVGTPLWDGIAAPPILEEQVRTELLRTRHAFSTAFLTAFGSEVDLPEPPADLAAEQPYRERLEHLERDAMQKAWLQALIQRAPYLGGGILVALLCLIPILTRPFGGTATLSLFLYVGTFHVLFFAMGGRYGAWLTEAFQKGAFERILIPMAGASAVAAAATGAMLARRAVTSRGYLWVRSLTGLLATVSALLLGLAGLLVANGWEFPLMLPGATWLTAYLLTLLQIIVLGGGAPVWAILATSAGRLTNRLFPVTPPTPDPELKADKVVRMRPIRKSTSQKSTRRGVRR